MTPRRRPVPQTPQAAPPAYAIVVPTVGRPSLSTLLDRLAEQPGPPPAEVVVVDDRCEPGAALAVPTELSERTRVRVLPGFGRGPAAARNLGWRIAAAEWVVFLDDDVIPHRHWADDLVEDLARAAGSVAAVQGRITVPLPKDRRPTDWERNVAGLETARWITADLACRRVALVEVHGFDERFRRAYREDADLALRLRRAGWRLASGRRHSAHPVRPASPLVSLSAQRGNADDALMRRLHGRGWREAAAAGRGRMPWHAVTTVAAAGAVAGAAVGAAAGAAGAATGLAGGSGARSRALAQVAARVAATAGGAWLALTGDFTLRRVLPGPRTWPEVRAMAVTSAAIPPLAVFHRLRGRWVHRGAPPWPVPVRAVVFDRDGTLVEDVPYNGDPARVRPTPAARRSLERLRHNGIRLAVATNQSGVARGLISTAQVAAVNQAVEDAVGPIDTWQVCTHSPSDDCGCRKPRPGLVTAAASSLGVSPVECVVIGDIGADVEAARAAGAASILVPTAETQRHEVAEAPVVAPDLTSAVDLVLSGDAR
jgi:HAD superfamily hydrolase (TIGR01662 family)